MAEEAQLSLSFSLSLVHHMSHYFRQIEIVVVGAEAQNPP